MQTVIDYIEQSSKQLVLQVFGRHPSRKVLNVLAESVLENEGIRVEAFVIGTSHAVLISQGSQKIAEIFSCSGIDELVPIIQKPLNALDSPVEILQGELEYSFESECKDMQVGHQRLISLKSRKCDSRNTVLAYSFPDCGEGPTPATVVAVELLDDHMCWETAHTYPNEDRVVFTRTILKSTQRWRASAC